MKNMLKEMWVLIKRNSKFTAVLVILTTAIFCIGIFNRNYFMNLEINEKVSVVTNIFAIIAALWAVYEFFRKNNRAKAEKAIELANKFESEIIPMVDCLSNVFAEVEEGNSFYAKIKQLKFHDGLVFDREELENIFEEKEINEYLQLCQILEMGYVNRITTIRTNNSGMFEVSRRYVLNHGNEIIKETKERDAEGTTTIKITKEIKISIPQILNKLESFSMPFNNNVADANSVYKSLHQVFFSTVKTLYVIIAYRNKYEKDKFYTNIISLFNAWDKKYKEIEKATQKQKVKQLNKFKRV